MSEIGGNLTDGEVDVLIEGLSDDVAFVWALICLGLRRNDGTDEIPTAELVDEAFGHFGRLLDRGLIRLGRMDVVDPDHPAGTVAPVKHVSEPASEVRTRVLNACAQAAADGSDWEWVCWIVNSDAGRDVARQVVERAEQRESMAFRSWLDARNFLRKFNYDTLPSLTRDVDHLDTEVSGIVIPLQRREDDREIDWPVNDLLADVDRLTIRLDEFAPATDDEACSLASLVQWLKVMRVVYVEALARRSR